MGEFQTKFRNKRTANRKCNYKNVYVSQLAQMLQQIKVGGKTQRKVGTNLIKKPTKGDRWMCP